MAATNRLIARMERKIAENTETLDGIEKKLNSIQKKLNELQKQQANEAPPKEKAGFAKK